MFLATFKVTYLNELISYKLHIYVKVMLMILSIACIKNIVTINAASLKYSQPKAAGVLLMGTGGRIKANSVEHMDSACKLSEDKVIHPFAFRTHTHALGKTLCSPYQLDVQQVINKKKTCRTCGFWL